MKNILLTLTIFFIYFQTVIAQEYSHKIERRSGNNFFISENISKLNAEKIADNPYEVVVLDLSLGLADSNLKYTYTYNSNNMLDTEIYQTYDNTLGFINKTKNTYSYNLNKINIQTTYKFSNSIWTPTFEYRYFHDLNGNLIKIKSFEIPSLKPYNETRNYYDAQGFLVSKAFYISNQTNNILNVKDSTIFVNNSLGNVITSEFLLKKSTGFSKTNLKEYFYDSFNRVDKYLLKNWDLTLLTYVNLYERIYSYSGSQLAYKNFIEKIWDINQYNLSYRSTNEFANNKLDFTVADGYSNGIWNPFTKTIYKYKTTGIKNLNNEIINTKLFPNPANQSFTYQITLDKTINASLSIVDLAGRVVYILENTSLKKGENTIFIPTQFEKGTYTLVLKTPSSIDSKKLIIN